MLDLIKKIYKKSTAKSCLVINCESFPETSNDRVIPTVS